MLKIGIITDPASTFRVDIGRNSPVFDQYNIPDGIKERPMSYLDYFYGNFSEVKTLKNELEEKGICEIVVYHNNQFIHEKEEMSIDNFLKIIETKININKWLESLNYLIICIGKSNIRSFINIVHIPNDVKLIVSSGKEDLYLFERVDLHIKRVGVARFGKKNRIKIKEFIEGTT